MIVRVPFGVPLKGCPIWDNLFNIIKEDGSRKIKSQYTGGILLQPVQKLGATIIFCSKGQKCKQAPFGVKFDGVNDMFNPSFFISLVGV
jgi:hypothetical protein